MPMDAVAFVKKIFGWLWKIVQGVRAVISLLLFVFIVILVLASLAPNVPEVADRTVLVIAPEGRSVLSRSAILA